VSNLCLILLANPDASFVAGFKAWLELGYCVRRGEHAIWIFAPMATRRRHEDPAGGRRRAGTAQAQPAEAHLDSGRNRARAMPRSLLDHDHEAHDEDKKQQR